eukprot:COSAG01_NODE_7748_length_3072_cov_2.809620_4_plen_88_part_00
MYTLVVDVERAAVRPTKSIKQRRVNSPLTTSDAAFNDLPATAKVPGRPIMQYGECNTASCQLVSCLGRSASDTALLHTCNGMTDLLV